MRGVGVGVGESNGGKTSGWSSDWFSAVPQTTGETGDKAGGCCSWSVFSPHATGSYRERKVSNAVVVLLCVSAQIRGWDKMSSTQSEASWTALNHSSIKCE